MTHASPSDDRGLDPAQAGCMTAHAISELCTGGDWACAHGDFAGLRHVAHCLATYASEPLHCELVALADACTSDPERAGVLWDRLKGRLFRA
jgi:hypothetical protein